MPTYPAPPFDPELAAALVVLAEMMPSSLTPEMIPTLRQASWTAPFDDLVAEVGAVHEERTIPGHEGADIVVSVYRPADCTAVGPGIVRFHGGGMIMGDRSVGVGEFLPYVASHSAVIVSVEYRLAPDFPDPYPVEDCYAGLVWTAANAEELGIDPARIVIAGASAGGGLAAGVGLLARDRKTPQLRAQLLIYPMLDDRNETISSQQIDGIGVWDRTSNFTGWNALLGERRGTDAVSIYASPARADDLSGLPPTFIDVGSAEVFRDEDVAYATRLWEAGGDAELHVWPGGFHGFDGLAPQAQLSIAMLEARNRWLTRMLDS